MINVLGTIQFDNEDDYVLFCENMNMKTALYVLENAINKAQSVGIYDIHESHLLYHSIEKMKKSE